jgi:hypothetical protein
MAPHVKLSPNFAGVVPRWPQPVQTALQQQKRRDFYRTSIVFDIQNGGIVFRKDSLHSYGTRSATARRESKTWKHVFSVSVIFNIICQHLEPQEILFLQQTCKSVHSFVQVVTLRQWSITSHLRRFVVDPTALRSQMALSKALISGSVALQFFDRSIWDGSDLDIYVCDREPFASRVKDYLLAKEGYVLMHSIDPSASTPPIYDIGRLNLVRQALIV